MKKNVMMSPIFWLRICTGFLLLPGNWQILANTPREEKSSSERYYVRISRRALGPQLGFMRTYAGFLWDQDMLESRILLGQLGLFFKWGILPAIHVALSRSPGYGTQWWRIYTSIILVRGAILEFSTGYVKGIPLQYQQNVIQHDQTQYAHLRLDMFLFFKPERVSWRHAFSVGEEQRKSGMSWLGGMTLGTYQFQKPDTLPPESPPYLQWSDMASTYLAYNIGFLGILVPSSWNPDPEQSLFSMGMLIIAGPALVRRSIQGATGPIREEGMTLWLLLPNWEFRTFLSWRVGRVLFRVYTVSKNLEVPSRDLIPAVNFRWAHIFFHTVYLFSSPRWTKKDSARDL